MKSFVSLLTRNNRFMVSNISPKKFKYTFQTGFARQILPMRMLADGTDRLLITSNLIVLADHGGGNLTKHSENLDPAFTDRLIKIINSFFYQDMQQYIENPLGLVISSVQTVKMGGCCTLTICILDPETGDVHFYYIGDSLYGIFKQKNVVMVQGLYSGFNQAKMMGNETKYAPEDGFVQKYQRKDIKNDTIVIGSNGLWNNVGLDYIHYQVRGPNSFQPTNQKLEQAVGREREPKSLKEIAERIGNMAAILSKRGNYQSPIYQRAVQQGLQIPKEGFLDDVTVILAKIKREVDIK